ncbi:hypothetical protein L7F22_058731 [Adiantum nelumboides]|nr:hypothetical protein [Adiantum nelumboides]
MNHGQTGSDWMLPSHSKLHKGKTSAVVVLDGWGEQIPDQYNAIHVANTPTMDSSKKGAPEHWRLIKAHRLAVGLPTENDMGNSEVGHNALGAGRIFEQGAKLVDSALATGKLFEGAGFLYIRECFTKSTLHLIGLLSNGGVHSRYDQLQALMKGCASRGAKKIRLHILTDGRDVLDGTSFLFIEQLEKDLEELRTQGVEALLAFGVLGDAPHKFKSAIEALTRLKAEDPKFNDQYCPPFVIVDNNGKAVGRMIDGDAFVTFNFRADRIIMLAKALEYANFDKFDRVCAPKIHYAGMLQYDGELKLPSKYLVSPPEIDRTSGEYFAKNGLRTFACSETVKFGHVTFFWNGNRSGLFDSKLETYMEIQSDQGITFNEKPSMKALQIGERARDAILSGKYDQVRVNLPNGDMVGHTGDIKATVVGCEAADKAVKMILDAVKETGGIYLVTADHGNAEDMVKRNLKTGQPVLDKNGKIQILTSHTCAPVSIAIGGLGLILGVRFRKDIPHGGLANVAATIMNLHGFQAPPDYERSLIEVVS